jgi:hypothetical protein
VREVLDQKTRPDASVHRNKGAVLLKAKPLTILSGDQKRFHHFGVDEVAVELIQLVQPEVVAIEVECALRSIVWIATQLAKILHQNKRSIHFLLREAPILNHATQHARTRRDVSGRLAAGKFTDGSVAFC